MKLITVYLPETYITALDQLVDERFYPNRAEAIRVAVRDLISAEVWHRPQADRPIFPVSKKPAPDGIGEVEANIEFQTHPLASKSKIIINDNYAKLAHPFCPHCGKPLYRSTYTWRGHYRWYCPDHGRVFPTCKVCDKTHTLLANPQAEASPS